MLAGDMPEIGQIKFGQKFDKKYEKGEPPKINRSPLSKFERKLNEFEGKVQDDTKTNNEFFTTPNKILESYRELPPNTGLAYGPSSAVTIPLYLNSNASAASLRISDHHYNNQNTPFEHR